MFLLKKLWKGACQKICFVTGGHNVWKIYVWRSLYFRNYYSFTIALIHRYISNFQHKYLNNIFKMTSNRTLMCIFSHILMFTLYWISATTVLEIVSEHFKKKTSIFKRRKSFIIKHKQPLSEVFFVRNFPHH